MYASSNNKKIRKAIFPVAGLGSRFLPATKASPKEMMPIVDKPLIQYAVEEAIEAGITELIFVTSMNKRSIEDHFDRDFALEYLLNKIGKHEIATEIQAIVPGNVKCIYTRQQQPLGLGHAILCAKSIIGNEPFAVLLPDDLMYSQGNKRCLAQMCDVYEKNYNSNFIAVQKVESDLVNNYGVIGYKNTVEQEHNNLLEVVSIVEKPAVEEAPSNIAVVGRYILQPTIFKVLEELKVGVGNEIQLTDAIGNLLLHEKFYGYIFDGIRYDCGNKLGYLIATVEFGLRNKEVGKIFKNYLLQNLST